MTPEQTRNMLAVLHGAYPTIFVDEAVALTWRNAFQNADYDETMQAVGEWTRSQSRFPTIAELNAHVRNLRAAKEATEFAPRLTGPPIATYSQALKAMIGGLRSEYQRQGLPPDEIERRIERRLPNLKALVASAPND